MRGARSGGGRAHFDRRSRIAAPTLHGPREMRAARSIDRAAARARTDRGAERALRGGPVNSRAAALATRTFAGRNAQIAAGRAFAPGHPRDRFDPARFGRLGFAGAFWPGPYFWPYAYHDETFWLWPSSYDAMFWSYGYDDLLYGIYRSYDPAFAVGSRPTRRARLAPQANSLADWCGQAAPGLTDWPVDEIAAAVNPNAEQRALLDELIRASDRAANDLRAACPRGAPVTPITRLEALQQQLDALTKALHTVRPALERFYGALSDEQKEHFNALGPATRGVRTRAQRETPDRLARACADSDASHWPTARIEQVVQPSEAQARELDALRATTQKAAETVRAACPTGEALTPTGRLTAMEQRATALRDAVATLRPALARFYDSLTDEQKARVNRMLMAGTARDG